MAKFTTVKLIHAALDEGPNGEIILRGVLLPESLDNLQVDDYQREVAPLSKLSKIVQALEEKAKLPDIEVGMRGGSYSEKDGVFTLKDSVYVIDGIQRQNAAMRYMMLHPGAQVFLGCVVHFNTTKEWERERFRILNTYQLKVSPNVLLRNKREESTAMATLYDLSTKDKRFVLCGRVSWGQRMNRGELLTALTLSKTVGRLHSHKARGQSNNISELVPALDKGVTEVGVQITRDNIMTFFDTIDEVWGIRRIQYREGAAYVKGTFLAVFAKLLSDHFDFWRKPDEKRLFVDAGIKAKLRLFSMQDPAIVSLASSAGKSRELLYVLLKNHINSGKRTKRLTSRYDEGQIEIEDGEEGVEADE